MFEEHTRARYADVTVQREREIKDGKYVATTTEAIAEDTLVNYGFTCAYFKHVKILFCV